MTFAGFDRAAVALLADLGIGRMKGAGAPRRRAWVLSEDSLVLIIGLVAAYRAAMTPPSETGDRRITFTYAALALALGGLMAVIPDPVTRP